MAFQITNKEYRVWNAGLEEDPVIEALVKFTLSDGVTTKIEYIRIKPEDMEAVDVAVLDGLDTLVTTNANS